MSYFMSSIGDKFSEWLAGDINIEALTESAEFVSCVCGDVFRFVSVCFSVDFYSHGDIILYRLSTFLIVVK